MQEKKEPNTRILVVGAESRKKEIVLQWMRDLCTQQNTDYEIVAKTGLLRADQIGTEDCIVLVPAFDGEKMQRGNAHQPSVSGDRNQSGKVQSAQLWQEVLEIMKQMDELGAAELKSILLVSDTSVYGKIFGAPHPVCEDEFGYVCHTSEADMAVQFLRTAEHFCSRLAREKGTPVRIARVDWQSISDVKTETVQTPQSETAQTTSATVPHTADESAAPTGADAEAGCIASIASALLKVLRDGVPGEAYNLPVAVESDTVSSSVGSHSPLTPIPITPNTRKAELLS